MTAQSMQVGYDSIGPTSSLENSALYAAPVPRKPHLICDGAGGIRPAMSRTPPRVALVFLRVSAISERAAAVAVSGTICHGCTVCKAITLDLARCGGVAPGYEKIGMQDTDSLHRGGDEPMSIGDEFHLESRDKFHAFCRRRRPAWPLCLIARVFNNHPDSFVGTFGDEDRVARFDVNSLPRLVQIRREGFLHNGSTI